MAGLGLFQETEGYSGSDIKLVCREAAMRPVRKIFNALEDHQSGKAGTTAKVLWEKNLCKNPTFTSRWCLAPVLGGSLLLHTILVSLSCTHSTPSSSGVLFWIHFAPEDKLLRARAFISLAHDDVGLDPPRHYINIK